MQYDGFRGPGPNVRRRCVRAGWVVALTIVLPLTGCGSNGTGQACTAVGLVPNGVNVEVKGIGVKRLAGAVLKVCTPRICTSIKRGAADDEPITRVSNPGISSTSAVLVSVTVHDAKGAVLVPTAHLTVVPIKAQPNGPGCDPTGFFATAVVTSTL